MVRPNASAGAPSQRMLRVGEQVRHALAEVLARQVRTLDEARPAAVARRRKSGQRTARENIALVTEIARDPMDPDEALALVGHEEGQALSPERLVAWGAAPSGRPTRGVRLLGAALSGWLFSALDVASATTRHPAAPPVPVIIQSRLVFHAQYTQAPHAFPTCFGIQQRARLAFPVHLLNYKQTNPCDR